MADWDTADLDDPPSGQANGRMAGHANNSYDDSESNRSIASNKESCASDRSSDTDLILTGGNQLKEESITEGSRRLEDSQSRTSDTDEMNIPPPVPKHLPVSGNSTGGTAKSRAAKSPHSAGSTDSIPMEDITIPKDANISSFSVNELATFLRYLNVEDRIVAHLHRKDVNGKRFSRLKDSELESLEMLNNPVILFFRESSSSKQKSKKKPGGFML